MLFNNLLVLVAVFIASTNAQILPQLDSPYESIRMVMDSVKDRTEVNKFHKKIIKEQKRAPDSRYNINVTNSDLTSLDRQIPNTAPPICATFDYKKTDLPHASVIIPFYNEALSMLLRCVHSILNRSPDHLLNEVILVDDHSPDLDLQQPLRDYVQLLPKVRLVRNKERKGLIVSRMRGASLAKGPVLIFLDAHAEVNERWLEPLLYELSLDKKQVIQPFVDAIDAMSLEIGDPGVFHKGSFSWDLRYTWIKLTDHEQKDAYDTGLPFFTPTLVGCAIVVDKDYFDHLGRFDDGMRVWGGENIELAFRTWMCGGKVKTVTCSHVGHVFKEFPYSFDGDKETIVQKNLIRVAETWMGGMKKYFYASTFVYPYKRTSLTKEEEKSLKQRKDLRDSLKCENFEWYLYNVIPQVLEPPMKALWYGEMMNDKSRWCWEVTDDYIITLTYVCYHHKIIPSNYFSLGQDKLLRFRDKCVFPSPEGPMLILNECPTEKKNLERWGVWSIKLLDSPVRGLLKFVMRDKNRNMREYCIEQVTNAMPRYNKDQMPQLSTCDEENEFQIWIFTYAFDFSSVPSAAFKL